MRQASQRLNADGGGWIGWWLRSHFSSKSFLLCDLRPSTRSIMTASVSGRLAQRTQGWQSDRLFVSLVPQVSQSQVIWTRALLIHYSQLLPVPCILWMVYIFTSQSCQVLHVALFSVPSSQWKVPQRQGIYLLPLVSLGILALTYEPCISLVSLWHQTLDCEIWHWPWTSPGLIISSFVWNWGLKMRCDFLNITQLMRAWISPRLLTVLDVSMASQASLP